MMKRIREASPRFKARIAGVLFLLVILTAAFTEFFVRDTLSFAADLAVGVIEVSGAPMAFAGLCWLTFLYLRSQTICPPTIWPPASSWKDF